MIGLKISGVCDSESGVFIVFFLLNLFFGRHQVRAINVFYFCFFFVGALSVGLCCRGGVFFFEDTIYESEKQESKWRRIVAHRFAFKFFVAGILSGESLFA